MMVLHDVAIIRLYATPSIPKILPNVIIPKTNENNDTLVPMITILLFSLPKNSDSSISERVAGTTTKLIIFIASVASINFGKNSLIRIGATNIPRNIINTEKMITTIFAFLF